MISLFRETPKRGAWVILALGMYVAGGGVPDLFEILQMLGGTIKDLEIGSLPTWGQLHDVVITTGWRVFLNLGFLSICFATCWASANLFETHLRKIGTITSDLVAAEQKMVLGAIEDCGVVKIFAGRKCPASSQPYADILKMTVRAAKNIRILSIAAYEYLGRKDESLLYEIIKNHPHNPNVEVILLSPNDGAQIISERVALLREREPEYTVEKMTTHINHTRQALRDLKGNGVNLRSLLTKSHPGFRILIADDTMFVSAYIKKHHGHEAHVFQITKTADATWFSAFEAYYSQIRDLTTEDI